MTLWDTQSSAMKQNLARSLISRVRSSHANSERRERPSYIEWVTNKHALKALSDDALLRRLSELVHDCRRVEVEVITHIAEVDARRLYAREAASSMFVYCTDVLHLSEHEAYLRIRVARAAREHPVLLDMLADGRIHLSGIGTLAPHLTHTTRDELLKRATHRSKRQIEELIAELQPRPDVPATVRKLPVRPTAPLPPAREAQSTVLDRGPDQVRPAQLGPDRVAESVAGAARPARIEPLAPQRYKVQFTASAELREKLERLQTLMRPSVPDGDLAAIIEAAVSEKLERIEAKRFGKVRKPLKTLAQTDTSASSRYIPAAVRRAVHGRDGGHCTFKDAHGRRCKARHRLEFHHHDRPYGRGGDHKPDNIKLMCRMHNALLAERDYGKEWIRDAQAARGSRGERPPGPVISGVHEPASSSRRK